MRLERRVSVELGTRYVLVSLSRPFLGRENLTALLLQKSAQTTDTYRLLARLVAERDVINGEFQRAALQERQYAQGYALARTEREQEGEQAREVRKMVGEGARGWLEEQCVSFSISLFLLSLRSLS
jgi:hypothetical protein